jgi:diacylglycerol kinase (ATP)
MTVAGRPPRQAAIIYNPVAGASRHDESSIQQARRLLTERGIITDVLATRAPGDATHLARQAITQGSELIIVKGGDGTLNETLQGIVGSDVHLAIWPAGTGNVLAGVLRIPRDLNSIISMIERDQVRRVSIGQADSRYFFLMAGIGLDAAIVAQVNSMLKRYGGILAYWLTGLKFLFAWDVPVFTLELDGQRLTATFAAIANAPSYGGGLIVAPGARMEDAFFHVCSISTRSRLRYLFCYLPFVFFGRHVNRKGVTYLKSQQVRAYSDQEIRVQVDGDLAGTLPMSFQIIPSAIKVVVP